MAEQKLLTRISVRPVAEKCSGRGIKLRDSRSNYAKRWIPIPLKTRYDKSIFYYV